MAFLMRRFSPHPAWELRLVYDFAGCATDLISTSLRLGQFLKFDHVAAVSSFLAEPMRNDDRQKEKESTYMMMT